MAWRSDQGDDDIVDRLWESGRDRTENGLKRVNNDPLKRIHGESLQGKRRLRALVEEEFANGARWFQKISNNHRDGMVHSFLRLWSLCLAGEFLPCQSRLFRDSLSHDLDIVLS